MELTEVVYEETDNYGPPDYDGLWKRIIDNLSYFRKKTPTSRNVKDFSPVSKWEMNFGWRKPKRLAPCVE